MYNTVYKLDGVNNKYKWYIYILATIAKCIKGFQTKLLV